MQDIKNEIESLRNEINLHNYRYYSKDDPVISDQEYDSLFRRLQKLESRFPELITDISPTQRVGGKPLAEFNSVPHRIPLLSLENAMNDDELIEFDARLKRRLKTEDEIEYAGEPKLDGLAVELIYENGNFVSGSTRGDGYFGEDITLNLKTIRSIPLSMIDEIPIPDLLEIRGEVFINHEDFKQLNQHRLKSGEKLFANPRNCAAGSLRQLDPKITSERPLRIFCYASGKIEGIEFSTHLDFINSLPKWGLPVNPLIKSGTGAEFLRQYHKQMENDRNNLPYDIDGVVFKVNSYNLQNKLGVRTRSPRWAIAGKFKSRQGTTVINDIIASIGRTGVITPVAKLEPILVGGVTVSNATLHNQDEIDRKDIRVGDTVIIQRAGDVIPEVVKVILETRNQNAKPYKLPNSCPSCGEEVTRFESEAAFRCRNYSCPAQVKGRINHFVSKRCMDIDGFGEKLVDQLVDEGILSDASDIFILEKSQISELERQGEVSAKNLITAIDESKKRRFAKFIHALGILHVGERASILLEKEFNSDINLLIEADRDRLESIHEFGKIMAESILDYFSRPKNLNMINKCLDQGIQFLQSPVSNKSKLKDKSFVITGTLENYSRNEAITQIEALGGIVKSSVSQKTIFVIAGKNPGSKYKKAMELGLAILTEAEFSYLLGNNQE